MANSPIAWSLQAASGELSPLVPHPIEIVLLLGLLGLTVVPVVAVVISAIVLLSHHRISLWPTFAVCVAFALLVPCIGWMIALAVLVIRRNEVADSQSLRRQ